MAEEQRNTGGVSVYEDDIGDQDQCMLLLLADSSICRAEIKASVMEVRKNCKRSASKTQKLFPLTPKQQEIIGTCCLEAKGHFFPAPNGKQTYAISHGIPSQKECNFVWVGKIEEPQRSGKCWLVNLAVLTYQRDPRVLVQIQCAFSSAISNLSVNLCPQLAHLFLCKRSYPNVQVLPESLRKHSTPPTLQSPHESRSPAQQPIFSALTPPLILLPAHKPLYRVMSDTSTGTTDFGSKLHGQEEADLTQEGDIWDVYTRVLIEGIDDKDLQLVWLHVYYYQYLYVDVSVRRSNNMTRSSGNSTSGPRLSDSECTLALRGTILTIRWTGGTGTAKAVTVNLNLYVAYTDGGLHWVSRGAGGFRSTSEEKSIRLGEGAVLVASCREGSSGSYQDVQLDLNAVAKMAIKAPTVYLPFTDLSKLNGNGT
ncbi:hypothetical protein C8F04DRAFT_1196560 [Mycena alexandri]|uniref:Uncharacterized protein n=1 Tax=Mycena alexandri TaxID=1745969 RepID=A0AAD6S450_9AGAR|nr:hypothetical protein C8F04DRAFT_1196560 [Mycena alexandri]